MHSPSGVLAKESIDSFGKTQEENLSNFKDCITDFLLPPFPTLVLLYMFLASHLIWDALCHVVQRPECRFEPANH